MFPRAYEARGFCENWRCYNLSLIPRSIFRIAALNITESLLLRLIWYIAGMAFDEDACDQNSTLPFFLPSITDITPITIPSQDFAPREN